MASKFLVTGATGRQGGATADKLRAKGAIVHGLVRKRNSSAAQRLEANGVILFEGDYDNAAVIEEATQEVTGIFLNLFPTLNPEDQIRQAKSFIQIAKKAGVQSVVISTAFLTGKRAVWEPRKDLNSYYGPKQVAEELVRTAGFQSYTILRPAVLMHNYLPPDSQWHFPELASQALIATVYEESTKIPYLDAADVGTFAVAALLDPQQFNGHEIELGYENLTTKEAGVILSKALGQQIQVRKRSAQEIEEKGIPYILYFQRLVNEVDVTIDGQALEDKYGIKLTSFEEFLVREKSGIFSSPGPG